VTYATWSAHHVYSVGVIDLREARIRRLASGASPFYPSAPLSPEGDAILLRRWSRLYRVDIATGPHNIHRLRRRRRVGRLALARTRPFSSTGAAAGRHDRGGPDSSHRRRPEPESP